MSRTIDSLNKAERERDKNNVLAQENQSTTEDRKPLPQPKQPSPQARRPRSTLIIGLAICLFLLLNLALTSRLFFITQGSTSERKNAIVKLDKIEESVSEVGNKFDTLSGGIKKANDELDRVNQQAKDNNLKIAYLEAKLDAKEVAIENLKKAKDTLFDRFNYLEIELNLLKDSNKEIKSIIQTNK